MHSIHTWKQTIKNNYSKNEKLSTYYNHTMHWPLHKILYSITIKTQSVINHQHNFMLSVERHSQYCSMSRGTLLVKNVIKIQHLHITLNINIKKIKMPNIKRILSNYWVIQTVIEKATFWVLKQR